MNYLLILGLLAGIFTTASVLPQIIHTYKKKQVKDLSLKMFIVLTTGVILWCIYGIIKKDWPIIITNGISVLLNMCMLYFIIRYSKRKP